MILMAVMLVFTRGGTFTQLSLYAGEAAEEEDKENGNESEEEKQDTGESEEELPAEEEETAEIPEEDKLQEETKRGNESQAGLDIPVEETEAPEVTIEQAGDQSPTLTLNCTEHRKTGRWVDYYICTLTAKSNSGKPIKWIQYGRSGKQEEWPGGSSVTFNHKENGTKIITVTDEAGNSSSVNLVYDNVDWFSPVITSAKFVYDGEKVNGKTKAGHILIESAYDDQFGMAEKPYSITTDRELAIKYAYEPFHDFSKIPPWKSEGTFEITKNGNYYLLALDDGGSVGYREIVVSEFDFDGPGVSVKGNADEVNGCTKSEEVVVSAYDSGAGIVGNAFSFDGGKSWTDKKSIIITNNQPVNVVVKDGLENRTEYRYESKRKFDNEGPEINDFSEVSPVEYKGKVGLVIVDVNAEDKGSQVSENGYSFDGGGSWQSSHVCELKKNGTYIVKVRDWLGNETVAREIRIDNIDETPPVISGLEQEFTNSAGGFGKSRLVTVHAHDVHSVISGNAFSFDGGETWQESPLFSARKNGKLRVKVRDMFGNTASDEITVTGIDETGPEINITGLPDKSVTDPVKLTISVSDTESGVESLWYKNNTVNVPSILKRFDLSNNGGGVVSGSAEASIAVNGEYTFISYDALGNMSEKIVTIDQIKKKSSDSSSSKKKKGGTGGNGSSPGDDQKTIVLPPSTGGSGENGGVISKSSSSPQGNRELDAGTVKIKGTISEDAPDPGAATGSGGKNREKDGGDLFTEDESELAQETDEPVFSEEEETPETEYEEEPYMETEEHEVQENLSKAPVGAEQLIASVQEEEEEGGIGVVLAAAGAVLLLSGAVVFLLLKRGIISTEFLKNFGEMKER